VQLLAGPDGRCVHTWSDDSPATSFGTALCVLGDLDRDGNAEIAIGAPGIGGTTQGRVLVFSGNDAHLLFELRSASQGDLFGSQVIALPDLDGDAAPEIAVASPRGGARRGGLIQVYSGRRGIEIMPLENGNVGSAFASDLCTTDHLLAIAGAARDGNGTVFVLPLHATPAPRRR
jgi:hypothetical protein